MFLLITNCRPILGSTLQRSVTAGPTSPLGSANPSSPGVFLRPSSSYGSIKRNSRWQINWFSQILITVIGVTSQRTFYSLGGIYYSTIKDEYCNTIKVKLTRKIKLTKQVSSSNPLSLDVTQRDEIKEYLKSKVWVHLQYCSMKYWAK